MASKRPTPDTVWELRWINARTGDEESQRIRCIEPNNAKRVILRMNGPHSLLACKRVEN